MKDEPTDPNRNEKDIYHRILSWCGEHKMKIGFGIAVCAIILLMISTSNQHYVEIEADWDTTEGGETVAYYPPDEPMIEIPADTFAKLNVKITAFGGSSVNIPTNLAIKCRAAKEDAGVEFKMNENIYPNSFAFPMQTFYTPKAIYEFSIFVKAPLDEDIYANKIEICAGVDSYPEECKVVWLRIKGAKDVTPTTPPSTTPPPNVTDSIIFFAGIVICVVITIAVYKWRKRKRKKKK